MKVPPELRRWMGLVWAGGFVMLFLAFNLAMNLNMQGHRARAERVTLAFYTAEASGKEPFRTFSQHNRDRYRELLDKYGRAQRVLRMESYTSLGGVPTYCNVYVQRSKSKSYETITVFGKSGVQMVHKDLNSPFK
ncbi:MAG: hypothetical protein H7Y17_03550 [Chlorobia bacterium]|nr:hypothetical protein [Fimbriimonadaceae bacterium]